MNADALLIATLSELEKKSSEGSHYDLVRVSGLLRQILLDGQPLLHRVNKEHRLKIRFKIQERANLHPSPGLLAMHGIIPHPNLPIIELNLDEFLNLGVLCYHNYLFTVHEIIDFTAHKLGGVHHDDKPRKTDKEKAFDHLIAQGLKFGFLKSEPTDAVVSLMVPISIATIAAIKPLIEKIQQVADGQPRGSRELE